MSFFKSKFKFKHAYFMGKVWFISIIKVSDTKYNLKYILDNFVDFKEYKGYLFFDIYTDDLDLIYQIKQCGFNKWKLCEFDYFNVLLGIHN